MSALRVDVEAEIGQNPFTKTDSTPNRTMSEAKKNFIPFDADEPTVFFRKLQRMADSEEWVARKAYTKALVFISENHEWVATKIEETYDSQINPTPPKASVYPTVKELETTTLSLVDPPSTRQLLMDRFERVQLSVEKSVEQVRQRLEDLFRRAVPEASKETISMFVIRQLIRGAPEAWQLRLKESNFQTVAQVEAKLRALMDAGKSELASAQAEVRRVERKTDWPTCSRCKRRGHESKDCKTECFNCNEIGHMQRACPKKREDSGTQRSTRRVLETGATEGKPRNDVETLHPRMVAAIRRGVLETRGERKLYPDANLEFKLSFGYRGELLRSVVDTGCAYNLMRKDMFDRLCADRALKPASVEMVCFNKSKLSSLGEIELEIELDAQRKILRWIVVAGGTDAILIGMEGAVQLELTLVARVNRATVSDGIDESSRLDEVLETFRDVFSKDQYDVGQVDFEHEIPTIDGRAVSRKEYRVPVNLEKRALAMLEAMKEKGLIQECVSPWAAPAIFLEKGNGQLRLVVNYQGLNEKTVFDPFPIPDMYGIVRKASSGYLFSTLDARNSFWHVRLRREDQPKTAFVSMGRQYMFNVMPMGLKGAPATLTRALSTTLREQIQSGNVFVFYDDIVICTNESTDQVRFHLKTLTEVLQKLRQDGWKMNREKCRFMKHEVQMLGHLVKQGEIRVTPAFQAEMKGWPEPENKKELQKFLGFAGFHAKFIKDYSKIAEPLTNLTGKTTFCFGEQEKRAFNELKRKLTSAPVLRDYDPDLSVTLVTDASDTGWGAVVEQEGHPVEFCSGKWTATERRYATTKKELKAILNGIKKFSYFLSGTHFTLVTDHKALACGIKEDCEDSELYRWARKLDPYSFSIVHRMGSAIGHADALSRKPSDDQLRRLTDVTDFEMALRKDPILDFVERKVSGETDARPPEGMDAELSFYEKQIEMGKLVIQQGKVCLEVDGELRIVVPRSMRRQIFAFAHSHEFAGHLGLERTRARIREKYFWFRSTEDIRKWKAECLTCAKHNVKRQAPNVSKKAVPIKGVPLAQWAMDVVGPLPRSEKGNLFILVITDRFTKWIELYALPDQKTEQIVGCLVDLVCRYSIPTELLSDNGSNFSSRCFRALLNALQVNQMQTSPYRPEGDGMTERLNASLMQTLRKYVEEEPAKWDEKLQAVAFSYRTSVHSVTGYSPYQLVFGRHPREPVHSLIDVDDEPMLEPIERLRRAEIWRQAAMEKIQAEQKGRIEEVSSIYKAGDLVMVKNLAPKNKLSPKYRGPFGIKEVINPHYLVNVDGKLKVVHGNHLKLFLRQSAVDEAQMSPVVQVINEVSEQEPEEESDMEADGYISEEWFSGQESPDTTIVQEEDQEDTTHRDEAPTEEIQESSPANDESRSAPETSALNFLPPESSSGRTIRKNPKYS